MNDASVDTDDSTKSPDESTGAEDEKSNSETVSDAVIVSAVATGSVVVLGTGGFSTFWFVIQKKSLAELLKLLIG